MEKRNITKKETPKPETPKPETPKKIVDSPKPRGRPLKYNPELTSEERIKLSKNNYRSKQKELYDTFSEGQKKLMKLLVKKKVEEGGEKLIEELLGMLE